MIYPLFNRPWFFQGPPGSAPGCMFVTYTCLPLVAQAPLISLNTSITLHRVGRSAVAISSPDQPPSASPGATGRPESSTKPGSGCGAPDVAFPLPPAMAPPPFLSLFLSFLLLYTTAQASKNPPRDSVSDFVNLESTRNLGRGSDTRECYNIATHSRRKGRDPDWQRAVRISVCW